MTNQASEDIDRILSKYEMGFVTHGKDVNVHVANFKEELYAIIRTEKLKLLAEVRERVVGEDESAYSEDRTRYFEHIFHQNNLRAEQRNKLTKLEAEL